MKLKELLSVVSDDLANVIITIDAVTGSTASLSVREMITHLDDDVDQVYAYKGKLRVRLLPPIMPDDMYDSDVGTDDYREP